MQAASSTIDRACDLEGRIGSMSATTLQIAVRAVITSGVALLSVACTSTTTGSVNSGSPTRDSGSVASLGPTPPTSPSRTRPPATDTRSADDNSFVMPNEVGRILQAAQDDIQRVSGNPVFFTSSTDATGAGRHQIVDRDWQVCTQSLPAGTKVGQDARIDFGVVKTYETCP
jgi:hypothetical protein